MNMLMRKQTDISIRKDNSQQERPELRTFEIDTAEPTMMKTLQLVRDDLLAVLRSTLSDRLYWTSSQTDLVVLCHIVTDHFSVFDKRMQPMTFLEVVRAACYVLHEKDPLNPWCTYRQAARASYRRRPPIMERYRRLVVDDDCLHPMLSDVACRNPMLRKQKRSCSQQTALVAPY